MPITAVQDSDGIVVWKSHEINIRYVHQITDFNGVFISSRKGIGGGATATYAFGGARRILDDDIYCEILFPTQGLPPKRPTMHLSRWGCECPRAAWPSTV
ncbi:hypothetical protein EVAR_82588_1 [Eumeta japonica]|uniref:Uncharacterized protein n=1 Tax=Eumeta variegata TaxID=151549 RepID=A0A4C1X2M4_EUMVA|nr:hypothetical protein EVAR_82588_1 [Eumeta japonica]